jgi:hypothetical protein
MARQELLMAHECLGIFGTRAQRLHEIADMIVQRKA